MVVDVEFGSCPLSTKFASSDLLIELNSSISKFVNTGFIEMQVSTEKFEERQKTEAKTNSRLIHVIAITTNPGTMNRRDSSHPKVGRQVVAG